MIDEDDCDSAPLDCSAENSIKCNIDDLKCLNSQCCGSDTYANPNQLNSISGDKCWCNKDDCRMYLETIHSDYYQQNSDIVYENINQQTAANINIFKYSSVEISNRTGNYYLHNEECTDTETTSSSDATMTSLDSGIRTVIYDSASAKEVCSLPKDEEDINKNGTTKPNSKFACVIA